MSDSSSSSDDEGELDIVSLITGSQTKTVTKIDTLTVLKELKHFDPVAVNLNVDDDFNIELPPVFQVDAVKNEHLSKRNKEITELLVMEERKTNADYHNLIQLQTQILHELNDNNGSDGAIRYLMKNHKSFVESLIRLRLKGQDGDRHYYFFTSDPQDKFEKSCKWKPGDLAMALNPANYKKLWTKLLHADKSGDNMGGFKQFIVDCLRIDSISLLNSIIDFLIYLGQKQISPMLTTMGSPNHILQLVESIGGDTSYLIEPNSSPPTTKLIYYNFNAELVIYKCTIIFYYIAINTSCLDTYLINSIFILAISDFNISKLHSNLVIGKFVPAFLLAVQGTDNKLETALLKHFISNEQIYNIFKLLAAGSNNLDPDCVTYKASSQLVRNWCASYVLYDLQSPPEVDIQISELENFLFITLALTTNSISAAPQVLENLYYRLKILDSNFKIFQENEVTKRVQELSIQLEDLKDKSHQKLGEILKETSPDKVHQREEIIKFRGQIYEILEVLSLKQEKKLIWSKSHKDAFYS